MAANVYDIGDTVRLKGAFTNDAGAATDPTAITLTVKDPTGAVTTYTYALAQVVKSATGIYYYDLLISKAGDWYYRFEGTGAVATAGEEYFTVKKQETAA